MADDTAALVLSLEARFDKFEKAMKEATAVVDRQTKIIEDRFTNMTNVISEKLGAIQGTLVNQLGTLGRVLVAMGPAGTAAAVGIGALVLGLKEAADAADRVGQRMLELRRFSIGTGFSLQSAQGLRKALNAVGVDSEQAQKSLELFTVALNELKQTGSGPLVNALNAAGGSLVKLMLQTEGAEDATVLLIQTLAKLPTEQRNALARIVGGRGGVEVFAQIAAQANAFFDAWKKGMATAKPDETVNKTADATRKLEIATKELGKAWDDAWPTESIMAFRIGQIESLTSAIKGATAAAKNTNFDNTIGAIFRGMKAITSGSMVDTLVLRDAFIDLANNQHRLADPEVTRRMEEYAAARRKLIEGTKEENKITTETVQQKADEAAAREALHKKILGQIDDLNKLKAVSGPAFTPNQQAQLDRLRLRAEELRLAADTPGIAAARVAGDKAVTEAINLQTLAMRERLGIATEQEIKTAAEIELNKARRDGIVNSSNEIQAALQKEKDIRERIDALAVKQSTLPQFTRLALDARNLAKTLDTLLVNSINTMADSFVDAISGTKSLQDAFRDMTNSILKDIARMAARAALLQVFSAFLPGGGAGLGSLLTGRAAGGPVAAGTPYVVGERGPELFMPPSAGFVLPNSAMRAGLSPINFGGISVDARGASPGVSTEIIRQLRAEMPGIALATVAQAQRYGVLRTRR